MSTGSGSNPSERDQPTIPPQGDVDKTNGPDACEKGTAGQQDVTVAPSGGPVVLDNLPNLDDYELIEELGRGGMGVVYKARQKKLGRTVALKMILGGQFASDDAVKRFELEAETAAKLDHPGIVPIYEIGQCQGNHFFSMKLIEGQSLSARLAEYQSDPRKAVRLAIEIAHAVHHAHERGILHRDLKPANILIDEEGRPAVTDLGLAKHLDDDNGLTQTGLVMGSPGFMSPEQAAGKSDVTTAVDVYSLGAVLYWMITGRPPFQADSRLEVILQTIGGEPESIRVHRPDADRDLNLICQKALQKSPANRYASVSDFADDLQAWLVGDALSVKPPSAIDHARIWIRKNFRTVALASATGLVCGLLIGMIVLMVQIYSQVDFTASYYSKLGERTTPWDVRFFSWVKSVPLWLLRMLPPSMVWINVFFGIVVIWLIKPKSREIGLVAATAAGLLAGIVAFTISVGWAPIRQYSIDRGSEDIELLAEALWLEEGGERNLAQRALVQRYPGLKEIDDNERGYIVYRKIMIDQSLGIPQGMWIGIGTTLCLCVLPLFFSATFSGLIWEQGFRGWAYFGKSIELGIYSALIFLVMTKFVTTAVGPSPGLGYQLFALGGLGLALYFGLSDKPVVWRVLGFVIANACIGLNFVESSRIQNAGYFAATAESDKEFQVAQGYFEKQLRQNDDPWVRFQIGILAAYRDDEPTYVQQCRTLLEEFRGAHRPNVAERIVKVCLLKPDFLSDSERDMVYELAELVSGYESSYDRDWLFFARALAEMRQGNLAETLHWNRRCLEVIEEQTAGTRASLAASCHVVNALAYQAASNPTEVAAELRRAQTVAEQQPVEYQSSWLQRMVCEILLEEATGRRSF